MSKPSIPTEVLLLAPIPSDEAERLRAITAATPADSILRAAELDQLVRAALSARKEPCGCIVGTHPTMCGEVRWLGGL